MKTLLLHMHSDNALDARMQVAFDMARAYGSHIAALQTHAGFVPTDMGFVGSIDASAITAELREQEDKFRALQETRFEKEGVNWSWHEADGEAGEALIANSIFADIVLIGQSSAAGGNVAALSIAGDVAMRATPPTMVIPASCKSFDPMGPIVVGWDGGKEASRAIRGALPLLAKARSVHLVTIARDAHKLPPLEAATWLDRQGVRAEMQIVEANASGIADQLLGIASRIGASALVTGAYSHSRLREALLGGVTRALISTSDIPLIMSH